MLVSPDGSPHGNRDWLPAPNSVPSAASPLFDRQKNRRFSFLPENFVERHNRYDRHRAAHSANFHREEIGFMLLVTYAAFIVSPACHGWSSPLAPEFGC
jgi:hypothetical protein